MTLYINMMVPLTYDTYVSCLLKRELGQNVHELQDLVLAIQLWTNHCVSLSPASLLDHNIILNYTCR